MKPQLLETLYQNYARELLLYLYSLCRNQAMAEDLLQEVFLKALLSLQDTHPNFRAWLYLVAKNLYLNQAKRHPPAAIPDDSSNPQDNPLELLLKQERLQLLFSALFSLSPMQREVITLQYFSGLSQKEIAQLLRLSPGNVRIIAHRAKKELKQRLEAQDYGRIL